VNDGNLIAVRVIGLPVDIWQRASSHQEAIQREFEIISAGQPAHSVPNRLQKLIEEFDGRFGEGNERDELQAAGHQGATKKDLCFRVPQLAAVAARRFGSMWAEVDAYCQSGDHLMTLATPPELVAFREWFLGEFIKQIETGAEPTSWDEFVLPVSLEAERPVRAQGNSETIVFTGTLDLVTAGELRDAIQNRRGKGVVELVLDLSNVGLVDSIGIGLLVTTHNRLRQEGATMRLIAHPRLQQLLSLSGLSELLQPEDPPA
jgi:anti-anti-sigma factor